MEKKSNMGKIIGAVIVVIILVAGFFIWFSGAAFGISDSEAKKIAYKNVPGAKDDGAAVVASEFDDLQKKYEVTITHDDLVYEFTILARNGKVTDSEATAIESLSDDQAIPYEGEDIGIEKAKEIALNNVSGAVANNITYAEADINDLGKKEYEIEITYDSTEYDFEIDAATGKILSQSSESVLD